MNSKKILVVISVLLVFYSAMYFMLINSINLLFIPGAVLGIIGLYFLVKSDKLLLIVTVYAFILDAGNGLLPIPLREITFALLVLKLIYYFMNRGFRDKAALPILMISVIIPLYGITVSMFRGNSLAFAFDDAKGYMFLLTALGLASIIYFNKSMKQVLLRHFIFASLIISFATIIILVLAITGAVNIYDSGLWMRDYSLGFAGIEVNGQYRVFFRAQLYVMFCLILVTAMYFSKEAQNKKGLVFLMLIFGACIIISNTRGLWLGSLAGLALLFFFTKFTVTKFFLVTFSLLIIFTTFPLYSEYLEDVQTRLLSSFEFNELESNAIRNEQSYYLLSEFEQYPIFGKGFGSLLSSGYIRSEDVPYSFELSYFELLYKLGLVGFTIFLFAIILFFKTLLTSKANNRTVQKGIFFSFLSFIILSSTNPYIVSSLGMFLLAIQFTMSRNSKQELTQ